VSRYYRFLYRIGFTPWEEDTESTSIELASLLDAEEGRREPPYGPALELGCGTGRWSVLLAERGWRVTGVDIVPKAIEAARERARAASVDVSFHLADVTVLSDAGIGSGYSFLLDVECFNHLNDSQRQAMGREVNEVAADDAKMLLLAWSRAWRGPFPPGANRDDISSAFSGWRIVEERPYSGDLPWLVKRANLRWYSLERT
jgi:SAM-dependent methyltransferase